MLKYRYYFKPISVTEENRLDVIRYICDVFKNSDYEDELNTEMKNEKSIYIKKIPYSNPDMIESIHSIDCHFIVTMEELVDTLLGNSKMINLYEIVNMIYNLYKSKNIPYIFVPKPIHHMIHQCWDDLDNCSIIFEETDYGEQLSRPEFKDFFISLSSDDNIYNESITYRTIKFIEKIGGLKNEK